MHLGHPALWLQIAAGALLALAAAGLVAGYFHRLSRLRGLGTDSARQRTLRGRVPGLRTIKGVLLLLGLAGLLFAMLRPQHGGREQLLRQFGTDVVVAVDFSKSMLAEDVAPSRIRRVRMEIDRLLGGLEDRRAGALSGNRVGAVAFAGDAIAFPVSTDLALASTFFRNFDPATLEPPGTAIGRALRKSQALLLGVDPPDGKDGKDPPKKQPGEERSRVVILFTDGEDHEGDPLEAARTLERETKARVFVVQVGELGGSTIPVRDPVSGEIQLHHTRGGEVATTEITPQMEETLKSIASPRGGGADSTERYYYRLGADGSVAGAIAADLRRLRRSEIDARKVTLFDELYWVALLPAVVLLAVEAALPDGFERRRRRKNAAAAPQAKSSPEAKP